MAPRNRRLFLKQLGVTFGAVAIGSSPASALLYYQKRSVRRTPADAPPAPVDFRYSPDSWVSPICPPADPVKSLVGGTGEYLIPAEPGGGMETVSFRVRGAGEFVSQKIEDPSIPFVKTSIAFGDTAAGITAFSTDDGDGGRMDHLEISLVPGDGKLETEIVITSGADLEIENEEDGDFEKGGVCFVRMTGSSDRILLAVDSPCTGAREGKDFILRPRTGSGTTGTALRFLIALPLGEQDDGDLMDIFREWERLRSSAGAVWKNTPAIVAPVAWNLWGEYDNFKTASVRIIEQMKPLRVPEAKSGSRASRPAVPDVVDEHFIAEAERYSGRDADAQARLVKIWNLQNSSGMITGAGGESNWKETAAAAYALCRHAELSGDWKFFNELYPDSFNAMIEFRNMRDRAWSADTANGRYGILPEGSPGPGWDGDYEEYTNTVWVLLALRALLEVSDRFFLPKRSELREFYGQLRAAFISAARTGIRNNEEGYSYLPMIHGARITGSGVDVVRPQSAQEILGQGLYPGLLFLREDDIVKAFFSVMEGTAAEDIPVGTGPGAADSYLPEAGAVLAQVNLWAGNSDNARKAFVGFLNHSSPVYTWGAAQYLNDAETPAPGGRAGTTRPVNVRASAECLRYLRHMLVLEDEKVLRLLDGITATDLADRKPMSIVNTPTRWGRVTLMHEPLDARAWKTRFTREPVNPDKAPPLESIEMPRRLMPNFQFDTLTGATAIKNGPRVFIDGSVLEWECTWRDFRRY